MVRNEDQGRKVFEESGSPEMFRVRYVATRGKRKDTEILEEITEIRGYWKRYGDSELLEEIHPMAALYCNTYYKSVPHVVQYNAPVHGV